MKVIHKDDISSWSCRLKCAACDAILEAGHGDIRVRFVSDARDMRGLDSDARRPEFYVICCECGGEIYVDEKHHRVSKLLQRRLIAPTAVKGHHV